MRHVTCSVALIEMETEIAAYSVNGPIQHEVVEGVFRKVARITLPMGP